MSADAVALDIAFVRMPAADLEGYEAIWTAADEQSFPPELRQNLATNGIRAGIFGSQLHARLWDLMDAKSSAAVDEKADRVASQVPSGSGKRHLQLRAGRRSKILASKTYPVLPVLLSEDGQVRGHELQQAQCLWTLRSYPQGDGNVKLDLTPEIEHGEMKSQWVPSEGSFINQVGKDRMALDRLRLEARVAPGQWLVLSCTSEIKGLGEHFFAESSGGAVERTFVLIRVTQTQLDDLFAPGQTTAALVTPGD
jgi:hypothetical protein